MCTVGKIENDSPPDASWPRRAALYLIRFYQNVISPRTPPSCFFYPTCSSYAFTAIAQFGLWQGGWLSLRRIARCHPFARGGYDPVPEEFCWWRAPRRAGPHKDMDE